MGPYPDLRPALPARFSRPTRTSRILQPVIVLSMVVLLLATTVVGLAVAGLVFSSKVSPLKGVSAAQIFSLMASCLSLLYLILHGAAAVDNEPVGMVRPPDLRLHASCFIVARLGLVSWMVSMITAAVIVSRADTCSIGTKECNLQVVDLINSNLGFLATGVIVTALEACQYPFQLPNLFHHTSKKMAFQMSLHSDEILNRSVSMRAAIHGHGHETIYEDEKLETPHRQPISRKPLPSSSSLSFDQLAERPLTPLLPMPHRSTSKSRGWGEEWTHQPGSESSRIDLSKSDSAVSTSQKPSSGVSRTSTKSNTTSLSRKATSGYNGAASASDTGSDVSSTSISSEHSGISRRSQRPRTVTPSSSIGNLTRRSPLSSMRSAEYPEILVRPEVRFCPPKIPSYQEWNAARKAALAQLMPVADLYSLQRRSSPATPGHWSTGKPTKDLPLIPRKAVPVVRRKTSDIRVPGAFIEYRPSVDHERSIDEHLVMIEVEYVKHTQSRCNRPRSLSSGLLEETKKPKAPSRVDSRARYRTQRPDVHRAHKTVGTAVLAKRNQSRASSAQPSQRPNLLPFRRLSLGDLSPSLGTLCDST